MGPEGHKRISKVLDAANISAEITPKPKKDERAKYVTIDFEPEDPAFLLNALYEANLTQRSSEADKRPVVDLRPVPGLTSPGRITFEDTAQRSYHHSLTT